MSHKILLLGMDSLFGTAMARAFRAAGWDVDRYREGSDISIAARGVRWIVNALTPPYSPELERALPDVTGQVIRAAHSSGAAIMMSGNLEVYGREPAPWSAGSVHSPITRTGRLLAEAEARYREAAQSEHRPVVLLRAGQFIMPGAQNSLMNKVTLARLAKGAITSLGRPETVQLHADLEEMTSIAVSLAETADAAPGFLELPFPGTRFSARDLAQELGRQLGRKIAIRSYPWWRETLRVPFSETARERRSRRYLFQNEQALDDGLFRDLFPDHQAKPLQRIVFEHLYFRGLKVVPEGLAAQAAGRGAQGQAISTQTIL